MASLLTFPQMCDSQKCDFKKLSDVRLEVADMEGRTFGGYSNDL